MTRTIYWVKPLADGWGVTRQRAEQVRARLHLRLDSKDEALARGRELARTDLPSFLFVQRPNGSIEEQRCYGADPYPPVR